MWMWVFLAAMLAAGSSVAGERDMSASEKLAAGVQEKAQAEGVVRVIVEVQPSDASLAASDRNARGFCENADCARVLVGQVMTPDLASNVKDVSDRMLAMDVTPEGLEALEQMPLVRRVSLDVLSEPSPVEEGGSDDTGVEPQPGDLPPDLSAPQ